MKRALLALVTLTACSSPAPAYRAGSALATTTSTSTTRTSTTIPTTSSTSTTTAPTTTSVAPALEGVGAASTPPPAQPPAPSSPPATSASARTGQGGTTTASWYGDESGTHTANGDRYDPDGLTFAHRSMPFGTAVSFCRGGSCVVATCTDRGPATWTGRDFDLSRATFAALAPLRAGVATVTWERLA